MGPLRATKTQRIEGPDPAPLFIRHLPAVRAPLFAFLAPRDVVAVLATSHALRGDAETIDYVLESNTTTSCFFHGCLRDWCAATPTFTLIGSFGCNRDFDATSEEKDSDEHSELCEDEEETHDQDDNDQGEHSEDDELEDMDVGRTSPAHRASLLSLAMLMETELASLLYSEETAYVTIYYVIPFILPVSRVRDIAQLCPPPGTPTPLGLHIENCDVSDHGDVDCALCASITSKIAEASAYGSQRETEEVEFTRKLRDDGIDDSTDAFREAMDAFYESKRDTDELYSEDRYDRFNVNDTIAGLIDDDKLGDVELCGGVDYDMALETGHDEYYDSHYGFCGSKLRPLVAFFRRNGFGRVHRMRLRDYATPGDGELPKSEIRSVEMVGAEAPHGFFAGVYFMARYT